MATRNERMDKRERDGQGERERNAVSHTDNKGMSNINYYVSAFAFLLLPCLTDTFYAFQQALPAVRAMIFGIIYFELKKKQKQLNGKRTWKTKNICLKSPREKSEFRCNYLSNL